MEEYFMRQMVVKVSLISDINIEWCKRDQVFHAFIGEWDLKCIHCIVYSVLQLLPLYACCEVVCIGINLLSVNPE